MGSNTKLELEVIALLESNFVTSYCELATCSLIFCEHLVTLPDEIRLVWRRKLTMSSLVFLFNRYILLAYGIINIIGLIPWTTNLACATVIMLYTIVTLSLYTVPAIFSTLRVYAITGRRWHLALATFLTGIVAFASNLFNGIQASLGYIVVVGPVPVCTYDAYYTEQEHRILTTVTRVCAIVSDLLVIIITWWRTYAMKREADRLHIKASLASLLLRDGTIYFVALLILNVVHIIVVFNQGNVVYVTIFLIPIPSLLTSRFLLNLRRANEATNDVHLASKSSPDSAFLSSSFRLSLPDMRTLQFTPPSAFAGAGAGSFMDMDGAVWTGHVSDEYSDPSEGDDAGEMWSPSTLGSNSTGEANPEVHSPVYSSARDSTVCEASPGGHMGRKGSSEIELTPV